MLRHVEDYTARRLPDRNGTVRVVVSTALAVLVLLAGPAIAHSGPAEAAKLPSSYVPYQGKLGDPAGLTSSGARQHGKAMFVAHAAHAGVSPDNPLANEVREVNARFMDVGVATAEGYAPIPCVSGVEGGAMGIHYVNGALIEDGLVDISKPEAVMYEPQADGSMQLVAVEYITTKGPANLDGHLFSFTNAPNRYGLPPFYELHVWAWRANPTGTFADMNPNVSCDATVAARN
jgi:hypothetical protein